MIELIIDFFIQGFILLFLVFILSIPGFAIFYPSYKKKMRKIELEYGNIDKAPNLTNYRILLLGDSIIDNKSYIQDNEYDVAKHLLKLFPHDSDAIIQNNAVDGDTMQDLQMNYLDYMEIEKASHIVLSIGGNDLLKNISFLQTVSEINLSRNRVFEETYFEIIKPFKKQYETIVANLSNHRANLLLCTVYEGDLVDSDEFSDVNNSSKTMVSIFNDIVHRTANKYGADVLELRDIFVGSEDYANPIEPSHIGGGKLAKAIYNWVKKNA